MRQVFSVLQSVAVAATCSSLLSGCVVAAVGVAAGAGYTMGQERGPGGVASDTEIKTVLNAKWAKDDSRILSYVDLNIFQGRVLLTGDVPNPEIRDEAVADAQKVNGVKEVINDIVVGQRSTFGSNASDNWILTRLRSSLTFDGHVSSLNYSLQVVDGVVYILGSAKNQDELDHVVNHARNTPDVVRVVSYIRLRPGAPSAGSGGEGTSYQNPPRSPPPVEYGNSPSPGPADEQTPPPSSDQYPPASPPPASLPPASPPPMSPPAAPPPASGSGGIQEQPL